MSAMLEALKKANLVTEEQAKNVKFEKEVFQLSLNEGEDEIILKTEKATENDEKTG